MSASSERGNSPERWEKLLEALDEKLQLGLLDHLKRVTLYHFEGDDLFIEPGSEGDHEYLSRDAVLQQFQLLAHDSVGTENITIRPIGSSEKE